MTTVSVIIPCFNAQRWLRAALCSVLQQALPELEIIVVDDGSTDASDKLVAQEFPGVRLVRLDHGGPSRARNVGTHLSRGQFIQYLDADDLLAPGKLVTQMRALAQSGADVAYGDWRELRPGLEGNAKLGRHVARRIEGDPEIALFTDFWCPPAAYLFRRTIVNAVGAWEEGLPIIQDARFVLDCALRGAQFVYCPGLAAYYRVHAAGSVSTRDALAFTQDCLRNAASVEEWWRRQSGLNESRTEALLRVYGQVARASSGHNTEVFDRAYAALERLKPRYAPTHPRHLAWLSRVVGYRRAESIAVRYRQVKHSVGRGVWRHIHSGTASDPAVRVSQEHAPERHKRLKQVARLAYAIPGVRSAACVLLRLALQQSWLELQNKQRLHNFFAMDVAPSGFASSTLRVPGAPSVKISIRVRDDLSRYWYFWGYSHYEVGTIKLLRRLLCHKETFFDVGANIGYYSLLSANILEGRGVVHAFEPQPTVFEHLVKNAGVNNLSCLHLNRVALSDSDAAAKLFIPGDQHWTNASLVRNFVESDRHEVVSTMRFDSYCMQHAINRVDLVKIDVEGAELRVLKGMGRLLDAWRPDIILEVLQPYEADLEGFLSGSPYRKFRIRDNGLEEIQRITSEQHDRNVYLSCAPFVATNMER